MEETRLQILGEKIFKNVRSIEESWLNIFGSKFENYWNDNFSATKIILNSTKERLNLNGRRNGHVSLFMRDPLSDRLILTYSTNSELNPGKTEPNKHYYSKKYENYDPQMQLSYYALCDRLIPDEEKKEKKNRKKRGLTGWVAVSGHPLRVNNERAESRLEDIPKDDPVTIPMCNKYGTPSWGNRIGEFPNDGTKKWTKRFLAVPVKSLIQPQVTIGVLRYTCLMSGEMLDHVDLHFLESMAELVSAVNNLGKVKGNTIRKANLPLAIKMFEDSGYIDDFLEFIANSLDSKIVSLYINMKCGRKDILRLFDAYGISGLTGELRCKNRILDYQDKRKDRNGLTLDIFNTKTSKPIVYKSVLKSKHWQGINTETFYADALNNLGINAINEQLTDVSQRRKLLETYSIKLMGIKLSDSGHKLGVLKVEFPSSFDSDDTYETDDEKDFYVTCAKVITNEILKYRYFLSGEWFKDADESKIAEFLRLIGQIMRVQLLKGCEIQSFKDNVTKYSNKHRDKIKEINERMYEELPFDKRESIIKRIWGNTPSWVKEALLSTALKKLLC